MASSLNSLNLLVSAFTDLPQANVLSLGSIAYSLMTVLNVPLIFYSKSFLIASISDYGPTRICVLTYSLIKL